MLLITNTYWIFMYFGNKHIVWKYLSQRPQLSKLSVQQIPLNIVLLLTIWSTMVCECIKEPVADGGMSPVSGVIKILLQIEIISWDIDFL